MPRTAELNQFRRLIGDYQASGGNNSPRLSDPECTSYLNDATMELTCDVATSALNFTATPVLVFDTLPEQYHNETIYRAAINWWWNEASMLQSHHTISVGGGQNANISEKWDRAIQMIEKLQKHFDDIQSLDMHIDVGNFSRFSKQQLRRIGGVQEEQTRVF